MPACSLPKGENQIQLKSNARKFQNFLAFHTALSTNVFEMFPASILRRDASLKNGTEATTIGKEEGKILSAK